MRGAPSSTALKLLQWFIRGVQLLCAILILAIYSYFLAALSNHHLPTNSATRSVEGISGVSILYILGSLVLLCCFTGRTLSSFLTMLLDVGFACAYIYVAVANKTGASGCTGDNLDTPFGKGKAGDSVKSKANGFTNLATYGTACKLQSACLALAIIAIFFYIFSAAVELGLGRNHQRQKRFTTLPGDSSLLNNDDKMYQNHDDNTSAAGQGGNFFSRLFRRATNKTFNTENALPEHTHPSDLNRNNTFPVSEANNQFNGSTYERVSLSDDHPNNRYETGYGNNHPSGMDYNSTNSAYGQQQYHHQQPPYPTHQRQQMPSPPSVYGDGIYDHA